MYVWYFSDFPFSAALYDAMSTPVLGSAWAVDDRKRGPSLSGGRKRHLDALASSLGLKRSVFVALRVGNRLPKTAVTGIRSCYCIYLLFCVEKSSSVCSFG